MIVTLNDALSLVNSWARDRTVIRLIFIGSAIRFWYSYGSITEVSGSEFMFVSSPLDVLVDAARVTHIDFYEAKGSDPIPQEIAAFVSSEDQSILLFRGATEGVIGLITLK